MKIVNDSMIQFNASECLAEVQGPCDRLMHILYIKAAIFSLCPFILVLHAMNF